MIAAPPVARHFAQSSPRRYAIAALSIHIEHIAGCGDDTISILYLFSFMATYHSIERMIIGRLLFPFIFPPHAAHCVSFAAPVP